jgi:hypothetical protein
VNAMTVSRWEILMTPDEKAEVERLRQHIADLRELMIEAKDQFDRACVDLYVYGRAIREQHGELYASDMRRKSGKNGR